MVRITLISDFDKYDNSASCDEKALQAKMGFCKILRGLMWAQTCIYYKNIVPAPAPIDKTPINFVKLFFTGDFMQMKI